MYIDNVHHEQYMYGIGHHQQITLFTVFPNRTLYIHCKYKSLYLMKLLLHLHVNSVVEISFGNFKAQLIARGRVMT